MASVQVTGGSQFVWFVSRVDIVVLLCRWPDGAHVVPLLWEEPRGCLHILWFMVRNASGIQSEVLYTSAIFEVRGRAASVFSPRCPDAKEHNWQLFHPLLSLEPSLQGAFQLAVETLNNAIGLRVVDRCVGG